MGIANYITLMRILISPIFLLIYMFHTSLGISSQTLPFVLLSLLIITELSDVLDGYIARKCNQVSDFGKIFDPMADSITRISVLLTFTLPPVNLPIPLILVFLYRDAITSTLRTICALRGYTLAARTSGKIKAIILAIASFCVLILMIPASQGQLSQANLEYFSTWAVSLAALYSVGSVIDYIYSNFSYIANALNLPVKSKSIETGKVV